MASSNKLSVKLLVNLFMADWKTVMGRNPGNIQMELGENQMNPSYVKKLMKHFEVPAQQRWRTPCLRELIDVKNWTGMIENFSTDDQFPLFILDLLCVDIFEGFCVCNKHMISDEGN